MPAFGNLRQRLVAVGASAGIVLAVSVPLSGGAASAASPVTPVTTTILKDAVTDQPWSGAETTGATAYDTATLAGTDGPIPTGTVTYTYFTNGGCQGDGATESVALVDGVPPDASATDPLGAGSYSFDAVYNGDDNYNPSAVSACEPFTVQPAPTSVANVVFSPQTGAAWSGTELAGGRANDTATLSGGVPGFEPTGTVTYSYFDDGTSYFVDGTCIGTPVWTDTVTLTSGGAIPDSILTDPLGAGTYSFEATYNGDTNYAPSGASACESFEVLPITRGGPTDNPPGNTNNPASATSSDPATTAATATGSTPASSSATGSPAFTATTAAPAGTTSTVTDPSGLAYTGADVATTAAVALGLLGLGSLLVRTGRRRRVPHGEEQ